MNKYRWIILCLCVLLPIETLSANTLHCAKMQSTLFGSEGVTFDQSAHEKCGHHSAQKQEGMQKPIQKDCSSCQMHSLSLSFIHSSTSDPQAITSSARNFTPREETLKPFITLPFKPPQA